MICKCKQCGEKFELTDKQIDHYKKSGSIPDELAVGRVAYSHNENCNCVEVYSNCCRVIMPDGSVKKIMNYELQG